MNAVSRDCFQNLGARVAHLRSRSAYYTGRLDDQEVRILSFQKRILDISVLLSTTQQVSTVFNALGAKSQEHFKTKVEEFVSYALSKVFEREYRFNLNFKQARKNLTVEFTLASRETGFAPTSLTDAHGGGVCEVAGFVLRLMFLMLVHNSNRQRLVLFLDEPFSWVSAQFIDNLIALIKELSDRTKVQFVVVTHNEKLAELGDKQYFFSLEDGKTTVKLLEG